MQKLIFRASLLALALSPLFVAPFSQATERNWSFTYNAKGLIESADGPRIDVSDITHYEYDPKGHLTRITNALGQITEFSNFDVMGNPQTLVDPNGVVTTLAYAPQGWLLSVSTATATTRLEHNAVGDITKLIRGDDSWLTYTWDDARRLIGVTNSVGEEAKFDLDPMGNRTATRLKDSAGKLTKQGQWIYDELGRLLQSVGAAGQTSRTQYDRNSNPTLATNPRNYSNNKAYDSLNRLVQNTNPLSGITRFEYDAHDNLTRVNDPRGVITRYQYDGLGNLIDLTSPDSGTSSYTHDAAGNITKKVDARGVVTLLTYDALNRLTARRYPAKPQLDTQFHYDAITEGNKGIGRLAGIEDHSGALHYTYNEQGNLTAQQHIPPINDLIPPYTIGYGYNQANQLTRIDYPPGFSITYLRNNAGQVTDVQMQVGQEDPTSFSRDISYLPFGPLKSLAWANGTTLERSYDLDYRLTAQTAAGWSNIYGYDANGNITKIQNSLLGELNYRYDALDRLTGQENTSQQQTFNYDAVGNRTNKSVTPLIKNEVHDRAVTTYQYGASHNRLTQIDEQLVMSDAAGNLTHDRADRHLTYNEQNRLASVKRGSLMLGEFSYNALGQRTRKITPQSVTTFLYGPDGQLLGEAEFDNKGKKQKSQYYVWLDNLLLGGMSVGYNEQGAVATSTPFYIHSDHLNTPRIATDSNQHTLWQWTSEAYGTGEASGSLTLNLRFPGQYYDAESGLYYNYFRDYDPETGRYVQSDSIGLEGGLNTYGYVLGNPLSYTDPYGLSATFFDIPIPKWIPVVVIPGISGGAAAMGSGLACMVYSQRLGNGECPTGGCHYAESGSSDTKEKKSPKAGISGKDGANDVPSWSKGERPFKGESGKDFADRLMGQKYGNGSYDKGPASEHNKIRKWGDRSFE